MAALIRFLIRRYGEQRVINALETATGCEWYPSRKPRGCWSCLGDSEGCAVCGGTGEAKA